jgi:hypothetical protein
LVRKPEGKSPLGKPRPTREDNITIAFRGRGVEGVNWINLVQGKNQRRTLVNMIMNFLDS